MELLWKLYFVNMYVCEGNGSGEFVYKQTNTITLTLYQL